MDTDLRERLAEAMWNVWAQDYQVSFDWPLGRERPAGKDFLRYAEAAMRCFDATAPIARE